MPRQNRVRPDGQIVAVPDRGLFWGNRGSLHQGDRLVRYSSGRAWIICLLEFKGRRRSQWAPGRLTELFFLDDATGLAAGHRPCGECRAPALRAFKAAWTIAYPGEPARVPEMDSRLHADRLAGVAVRRTYEERLVALPDGAMVDVDGRPWLILGDELLAWGAGGYGQRRPRAPLGQVTVITPRATVATIRAGYVPELHPTAF
ncbi:MAG: hypothetical protein ACR2MY_04435 [Candidatus Dormibacteria bacterium]